MIFMNSILSVPVEYTEGSHTKLLHLMSIVMQIACVRQVTINLYCTYVDVRAY